MPSSLLERFDMKTAVIHLGYMPETVSFNGRPIFDIIKANEVGNEVECFSSPIYNEIKDQLEATQRIEVDLYQFKCNTHSFYKTKEEGNCIRVVLIVIDDKNECLNKKTFYLVP